MIKNQLKRIYLKKYMCIFMLIVCFSAALSALVETGDANGNGTIDIVDALTVANYAVGKTQLFFDAEAADVDGNAIINIVDALIIAQYSVGIISKFPKPTRTRTPLPTPTPVLTGQGYPEVINAWAKEQGINLTGYVIKQIESPAAVYMLPGYTFFSLIIRQYPVAYGPPDEKLGTNSLVGITKDNKVALIQDEKVLMQFYKEHQIAVPRYNDPVDTVQAVKAWLQLSQEFKNDGFYTFFISDDTVIIIPLFGDMVEYRVEGTSKVAGGGEGAIKATLTIDWQGFLLYAAEEFALIPGVRPICQSTKLLDKDPIVRKMAEQDLLTMGIKVKDYLFEQRAKAAPALKKAIDAVWQKILKQEEKRKQIYTLLTD